MSEQIVEPVRLSPSELRSLFLFELDDDQLTWLSRTGTARPARQARRSIPRGSPRPASSSCSPAH